MACRAHDSLLMKEASVLRAKKIDKVSHEEGHERYQQLEEIGKGGMGEVFLAYDTLLKRHVAIKQRRSDKKFTKAKREQFLKEAHNTCQLFHPAIVPIYDIVIRGKCLYYVMPHLEGRSLKELIEEDAAAGNTESVPAFVRMFYKICQAVAYAHSKGFIHRDLKPSNIIIGPQAHLSIIDWGLISSAKKAKKPLKKIAGTMLYFGPRACSWKIAEHSV